MLTISFGSAEFWALYIFNMLYDDHWKYPVPRIAFGHKADDLEIPDESIEEGLKNLTEANVFFHSKDEDSYSINRNIKLGTDYSFVDKPEPMSFIHKVLKAHKDQKFLVDDIINILHLDSNSVETKIMFIYSLDVLFCLGLVQRHKSYQSGHFQYAKG